MAAFDSVGFAKIITSAETPQAIWNTIPAVD